MIQNNMIVEDLIVRRRHILGIDGMKRSDFMSILKNAQDLETISSRDIKKVPTLRGRNIINLFLESSTRTRVSFELAAKRLSADAINISGTGSSVTKGESLLDTGRTLQAMSPDIIVVRHDKSGAAKFLAKFLPNVAIINAGDGTQEHPTQALLDFLTITNRIGTIPSGITVAIVGDILHSRVARSNIYAHLLMGNNVRLVGPPPLVPLELEDSFNSSKVKIFHDLNEGIKEVEVIMALRIQRERIKGSFIPCLDEYSRNYGLSLRRIKELAPDSLILHPGPINRGVEISSDLADATQSLITDQVASGVAVRMACLIHAVTKLEELSL
jgi:aspartate carbamoyltransferase catalytic subunit